MEKLGIERHQSSGFSRNGRLPNPEVPPKVEYSLNSTRRELIPFIEHLHNWGKKQLANEYTEKSS